MEQGQKAILTGMAEGKDGQFNSFRDLMKARSGDDMPPAESEEKKAKDKGWTLEDEYGDQVEVDDKALAELPDPALAETWLPRVAEGAAILGVGHSQSPFIADAHVADLLLMAIDGELHAIAGDALQLEPQPSNDGSQRLFRVDAKVSAQTCVATGATAAALLESALDRGALFSAAQALGVADRLIELAVDYANQREQFGVPIGSFQAVKHMLADVKVALEYARSHVYRAANSVARATEGRAVDVSMAKLAACEAANRASRVSLQVHGAIGYTYEQDVHIWMKRAWSLEAAFGNSVFHNQRLASGVIDRTIPAQSFGYISAEA